MWIGGLAVYGPIALFWPLSYINNVPFFKKAYLWLWNVFGFYLAIVYHLTVLISFAVVLNLYRYSHISILQMQLDALVYFSIVAVLFNMLTIEFRKPFLEYYTITYQPDEEIKNE